MINDYVLDSSAVLALLHRESGAEKLSGIGGAAVLSSVNYCECLTKLIARGMPETEARAALHDTGIKIMPFIADIAVQAASLITRTKPFGLSLGDRACLATALHLNLEVMTADRIWAKLDLPVKIMIIR